MQLSGIKRPGALAEEVYSRLYEQLMTHAIAPGAKLSVDGLARLLDVSQTPIREALARLEAQGLVVKVHLIGYRVAPPMGRDRVDQVYEMRLLTEPHLAALAAQRMGVDDLKELNAICDEMAGTARSGAPQDYARFSRLDEAFHRKIAVASGNGVIEDALAALHVHVHLFRLSRPPSAIEKAVLEHERLRQAIAGADSKAAEAAMLDHILRSRQRFVDDGLRPPS